MWSCRCVFRTKPNTSDQLIIRTVHDDLAGWKLSRVLWVADRGFSSVANRAYLQKGGGQYVLAERLRGGSAEARVALARAGRYRKDAGNLEVKEVRLGAGLRAMRFVVVHNPEAEARDVQVRAHVQLCWLALLLIRVCENTTGDTWRAIRDELERMHLVTLETGEGRVARRTQTTAGQRRILAALELPEPPLFSDFEVGATAD